MNKKPNKTTIEAFEAVERGDFETMSQNDFDLLESIASDEERFPHSFVEQFLNSENSKVKIMRQYRNLSLAELAKKSGISEAYLFQIENKKRKGTIDILKKLSISLDTDIDLIT